MPRGTRENKTDGRIVRFDEHNHLGHSCLKRVDGINQAVMLA